MTTSPRANPEMAAWKVSWLLPWMRVAPTAASGPEGKVTRGSAEEIVAVAASGLAAIDLAAGGATGSLLWESSEFPLNRKLDHLFTNRAWAPGSVRVMQDAVLLSDHVPLVAGWQVVP